MYRASHPSASLVDEALWATIEDGRYDLVVVDTLSKGSPGVDENNAKFAEPANRAGQLAHKIGTTTLFLHHTGRSAGSESLAEIMRGSSALPAAMDSVFFVKAIARFKQSDRTEHRSVVVPKKVRGRPDLPDPFTVRLTDARGLELHEERRGKAPSKGPQTDEDRLLEAIKASPGLGGRRELAAATGLPAERVTLAKARLLDGERIENRGSSKRPELYPKAPDEG